MEERLLAVTRDTAAKIARLSRRQADYWARTDLVPASIDGTVGTHRHVRLYLLAGRSNADVLEAYPDLADADVEAIRRDMAV